MVPRAFLFEGWGAFLLNTSLTNDLGLRETTQLV